MSPTIPILSALLLSLILGSTEGGQWMESVSLLRQTLQYWRKIYKTYIDEVTLGYCWTDYLLKISNEWPTNLPTPTFVATEVLSNISFTEVTQFNKIHPREKHSQIVPNNYTEWNGKIDENERIARMIDSHIKRRRRAVSMPELLRDERETLQDGHEFSSRGTSSHAVNPTPNPRDDDKVDSGSTDLGEEDSRRKVLRSLTSHRDSFVEDAFASRSFSLKVAREGSSGDQRFPFRRYLPSRKRNSRVVETLSDPWMQEDHRVKGDPAGRQASLNNDGSSSALSRSQFRRVNADTKRSRMSVVKLMDSEGNLSSDLTINSTMSRRKPEELSRDLLLSPHGGSAIAERSLFEFRGSGGDALKGNNVFSSSNIERFNRTYENSTSQLIQHSKPIVSQKQPQLFDLWPVISSIRSFIVDVFGTLGMFVYIGRHIINIIQTNVILVCTREYVWTKIIKWIDD
ncbi:hypothetical protein ALC60_11991 [Trachymyrmex zeteki]|uniref:Uncharacterized protein n=1 Tax=Mycetomoellerius zeteki TaxID=64791 RepID=A0A151WM60_9HYME|nr:hypothetical protein ALC60_11991 [Trachymyrmex zeteki]